MHVAGVYEELLPCRALICKPFKEARNRFPAWHAGTTTLFDVPARQATEAGEIDYSESIPGLLKGLQIRALMSWEQFLAELCYLSQLSISSPFQVRQGSAILCVFMITESSSWEGGKGGTQGCKKQEELWFVNRCDRLCF